MSGATVYKHLQKLIDAGTVKEVALDDDQRRQATPRNSTGSPTRVESAWVHITCSPSKRLQQIYDTIADKPEKIVKYENTSRPDDV